MATREQLLRRLEEIAGSLRESGRALALLGLGSAGVESGRLDRFSDLDFFAVVTPGSKAAFVEDLWWLSRVRPIAFSYRNTADGYRALFDDGVFCEFAVFEPSELSAIPFAPGRVVWAADGFDASVCEPRSLPAPRAEDLGWLAGEALSSLYVGMCRWRRGELLAAMRAVQVAAVDALARMIAAAGDEAPAGRDRFANERRFEARFPSWCGELGALMQGYLGTRESALAVLSVLEARFGADPAMAAAIRELCGAATAPGGGTPGGDTGEGGHLV